MKNPLFQNVRVKKPKYNAFDLGHEVKLTMNMGELVPIMCQEIVPGDRFKVTTEMLMRLAPMISPAMHRINAYTHYFFVPNRLVYDKWEDFITGGEDGLANPAFPQVTLAAGQGNNGLFKKGSLADYMGLPTVELSDVIVGERKYNALPFRAYQLIYNEYYRDQNLMDKVPLTKNETVSAEELVHIMEIQRRCWEKDYFTSALPWAQRGAEVKLPLGDKAPVVYDESNPMVPAYIRRTDAQPFADGNAQLTRSGALSYGQMLSDSTTGGALRYDPNGSLNADLSNATSSSVNDLRRAFRLQEFLEKSARGGSRYIEQILSHFGVRSSDQRLQRPQFLGGGKSPVVISEVLSTVGNETAPQGNMAGHGIAVGSHHGFNERFEEHGYIIGILSVLPRTAYSQGVPRMFSKMDKFDFYWPEFANIGEQEVLKKEIYQNIVSPAIETETFGYQSRYAEYKFANSRVHGDFRDTMAFWHMGRMFSNQPELNHIFVRSYPSHDIFAVSAPDQHKLYVQLYNDVKAIRPMPVFGTPSF